MQRYGLYCFVLLLLINTVPAYATLGLGVGAPRVELSIPPGKQATAVIPVRNPGDDRIQVTTTIQDAQMTEDGRVVMLPPGTTPRSAASWLWINPTEFALEPSAEQPVRFTVTVPPQQRGGSYYAFIVFQTVPNRRRGANVALSARVGSAIIVNVQGPGLHKAADLLDMQVSYDKEKSQITLVTVFANQGTVLLRPEGTITLRNGRGQVIASRPFNKRQGATLPETARRYLLEWKYSLSPGEYTITAEIDYGARALLVGETRLVVHP